MLRFDRFATVLAVVGMLALSVLPARATTPGTDAPASSGPASGIEPADSAASSLPSVGWPSVKIDDPAWAEDVQTFYAARSNTPLWHDENGLTERGRRLEAEMARAGDWGLDPSAYRSAPPEDLTPEAVIGADVRLSVAAIRYADAAQNGQVDPQRLSRWLEATRKPFSAASVLAAVAVADDPGEALRGFHPQHPGFVALQQAYLAARDAPKAVEREQLDRMRANLERWRWLPSDLGPRYVWNNIPEYETRLIQGTDIVFRERLVVGSPRTQTPVFSDTIRFVVFNPDWGVPPSLKVRDLLPRLASGDTSVLERRDMKVVGRDARSIDWNDVDIRGIAIVQRPGPSNPLGRMKFMFPNRHDVYMHDTPSKGLFAQRTRALSNGCIRVRKPERFAELLLAADKGWSAADIARQIDRRAPDNNRVDLTTPVPVHNVYFTMLADVSGTITTYSDVYGHDRRVIDALNGKPIDRIAARDPALAHEREIRRIMEARYEPRRRDEYAPPPPPPYGYYGGGPSSGGGMPPWARRVFGFPF